MSGANRGFGSNFGSGGPPRGSNLSSGGRGGRDLPPTNDGAQSGGRGGGPSNGSRGTVPNMASNGQRGGGILSILLPLMTVLLGIFWFLIFNFYFMCLYFNALPIELLINFCLSKLRLLDINIETKRALVMLKQVCCYAHLNVSLC